MQNLVYPHEPALKYIALAVAVLAWAALVIGTMGIALVYLLMFFLFYLFAHSGFIAYLRGNTVHITAAQMPDLHARIARCCRTLGIDTQPEAYLLHGNGVFNAFATRFLGRNYIVLLSDVVDALADQPGALDFYIGHELGHVKQKHLVWGPVLAPALVLPLLGPGYSRAREYTCDRHGLACCERPNDGMRGMAALAAGHERWRALDLAHFQEQARASGGFWMSFHELVGGYPWLAKRMAWMAALAENTTPQLPRRNPFAWLLALFVPRVPVAGGGSVLVVVAMIGVLAAVAIPAYQDYTIRAQVAEGVLTAREAEAAVGEYYERNGKLPADNQAAGIAEPAEIHGKYFAALQITDGIITVTYGGAVNALAAGKVLVYVPTLSQDHSRLLWSCNTPANTLPNKYLPAACRR